MSRLLEKMRRKSSDPVQPENPPSDAIPSQLASEPKEVPDSSKAPKGISQNLPENSPPPMYGQYQPPPGPPPGRQAMPSAPQVPIQPPSVDYVAPGPAIIPPGARVHHHSSGTLANAGMMGGMAVGMAGPAGAGGGNMVGDMLTGLVVGNMIEQRVNQHAHAVEARAAMASGVPLDPTTRAGRRAERRKGRYERRTKRHETMAKVLGGGKSSSSDE